MKHKVFFLALAWAWQAVPGFSQQVGSFNTSISFNGQARTLSCHVPTSYDSTISYRLMIGLHGLGDNSTNYRNALINALNWPAIFPNTIFVFPDGGSDPARDFYSPPGDEAIIDSAIQFATGTYSIDSSRVILQGFSLGGRSALAYGLDNPSRFWGLLLNTPAIQGLRDAMNDTVASIMYNYGNARQIPTYITVGGDDIVYVYTIGFAMDSLLRNDGIVQMTNVAGVGHTVPGSSFISPCLEFFDSPPTAPYDVEVFDIDVPDRTCDNTLTAHCYVRNLGDSVVQSIELNYDLGGNAGTHTWTGSIGAYEHAVVTIPQITTTPGKQPLDISVGAINTTQTDTITANNQRSDTVEVEGMPDSLAVTEGFENRAPGWNPQEGSLFGWYFDSDVMKDGDYSIAAFNTILIFYTLGNVESFTSPTMDLSTDEDPLLTFDIAFNYHRYTPPYLPWDTVFADTLEIGISLDCGDTYQTLYRKGGAELATDTVPMLNPLNLNQIFYWPDSNGWRQDTIDLAAFETEQQAMFKFNYISAMGGSIYIDNIRIGGKEITFTPPAPTLADFRLYPNPAGSQVYLELPEEDVMGVEVYDLSGKRVLHQTGPMRGSSMALDVSRFSPGMYTVQLQGKNKRFTQKLVISR